eukprot:897800_1
MSALSLYESILNGGILTIQNVSAANIVPLTECYPNIERMLKHYEKNNDTAYINDIEIKKISGFKLLRKRLKRDTDSVKKSEQFTWKPTAIEMR